MEIRAFLKGNWVSFEPTVEGLQEALEAVKGTILDVEIGHEDLSRVLTAKINGFNDECQEFIVDIVYRRSYGGVHSATGYEAAFAAIVRMI